MRKDRHLAASSPKSAENIVSIFDALVLTTYKGRLDIYIVQVRWMEEWMGIRSGV
jgi:hypothetical protein